MKNYAHTDAYNGNKMR